jgi:Mrp family chromosome partitioning ATPase
MLGDMAVGNSLLDCLKDSSLSIMDCVRTDKTGTLQYISGRSTDKRHYTLEYRAMRRIIDTLAQEFEYVVIDTPPSEVVSDATALCRYAECVLYVVRQDYAKRSQVINAITALHQKDVQIAGCVFNGVPQFHRQYGYGYRSSYGYGYDYGYRKYNGYGSKYGYGYSKYAQKGDDKS